MPLKTQAVAQEGELIASYPADPRSAVPMSEYRSTWIVSSLDALRSLRMYERYSAALHRLDAERGMAASETILSTLANSWLPVPVARLHYDACDTLGLSESEVLASSITAQGGQVRRTWHAQIITAAQRADADAWSLLQQVPKWWPRTGKGGALALYRCGPKHARVEYRGCSLFEVPYYCYAVRAVLVIFAGHFCRELTVQSASGEKGSHSYHLRWQ